MHLTVQVDIDGVLCDFFKKFYDTARQYDSTVPMITTVTQKDWHVWEGVSQDIQSKVWRHASEDFGFWFDDIDPLFTKEEGREFAKLVNDPRMTVYFVTARPGKSIPFQTRKWFRWYLPTIQFPNVISTGRKEEIAKLLKVDVSIEDNGPNAARIRHSLYNPNYSYLMDRLYNRGPQWLNLPRVYSLGEFTQKAWNRLADV